MEGLPLTIGTTDSTIFGGLPFIMNGDDLIPSVDLHVHWALNGSKALCGLVIYCHSSVLMTGINVPFLGSRDRFPLWHHGQNLGWFLPCTPVILSSVDSIRHPNFPQWCFFTASHLSVSALWFVSEISLRGDHGHPCGHVGTPALWVLFFGEQSVIWMPRASSACSRLILHCPAVFKLSRVLLLLLLIDSDPCHFFGRSSSDCPSDFIGLKPIHSCSRVASMRSSCSKLSSSCIGFFFFIGCSLVLQRFTLLFFGWAWSQSIR